MTSALFNKSKLSIFDNSGADRAYIIKILGRSKASKGAQIGDMCVVVISKSHVPDSTKKRRFASRGQICKAVIVQTRSKFKRDLTGPGSNIRFFENGALIVKKDETKLPFGTRIETPILLEFRKLGFFKLVAMAPIIL